MTDQPRISIVFRADGEPIAQPRPRISTIGGFARAYVPASHAIHAWRRAVQLAARQMVSAPIDEALRVKILFEFSRPKSHWRTGRYAGRLKDGMGAYNHGRPDIDNLVKGCLDAMNDCDFWTDDALVVHVEAVKQWAVERPGATIFVESIV